MASGLELFSVVGKLVLDKGDFDSKANEAEQTGKSLAENLSGFFDKVKTAVKAAAVVAAVKKISSALWNLANDVAAVGDKIDKQSQALGLSRKAYQEWEYILGQSGASIDSMAMVMRTMGSAISENSAETAAALSKLGLSAAHLQSIAPEQQFEKIVRAFQQMPPSAQKTQLALQLFGRGAQELMPLLNSATDSIDQLRQNAEDLGLIMSDEDVDASVAFGDALDDLTRSWNAFKNRIGAQLLPGFTDFFIDASHTIGRLSTELVGAFKSGDWATFFATLSTEIGRFIPGLVDGALKVINGIAANADKFTSIAASIVSGLATAIGAAIPILVENIPNFVSKVWDGLKGQVNDLANDIIGELNTAFGTNIPEIDLSNVKLPENWDEVKTLLAKETTKTITFLAPTIDTIISFFDDLEAWKKETFEYTVSWVVTSWANVQIAFNNLHQWLSEKFEYTVTWFITGWANVELAFIELEKWVGETWEATVSWVETTWSGINDKFVQLEDWVAKGWNATVTWVQSAWDDVSNAFNTVGQWVGDTAHNIYLDFKSTVDDIINTIKGWADQGIGNLVLNFISGTVDSIITWIKGWTAPKSAKLNLSGTPDENITNVKGWIEDSVGVDISFSGVLTGIAQTVYDWIQNGVNVAINFLGGILGIGGSGTDTDISQIPLTFDTGSGSWGVSVGGSFAKGLNYVPFDGLAMLHRGETILNQDQGREWRQSGGNGFDMREIGGMIADAVAAAVGDIQINMDGRQVGNAVTDYVSKGIYQRQNSRRFAAV